MFPCISCRWTWSYLSYWSVAGAGVNFPPSRLIMSLPSAGWTVYRRLHSLPTGAFWLGCPNLGPWLGIFSCTYVHTSLRNKLSNTHSKMDGMYSIHTYKSNHTIHAIGEDRSDLMFRTPSVAHTWKQYGGPLWERLPAWDGSEQIFLRVLARPGTDQNIYLSTKGDISSAGRGDGTTLTFLAHPREAAILTLPQTLI